MSLLQPILACYVKHLIVCKILWCILFESLKIIMYSTAFMRMPDAKFTKENHRQCFCSAILEGHCIQTLMDHTKGKGALETQVLDQG